MLKALHLLCVLGTLMFLRPAETGYYDYDNEVYDYYRQASNNHNPVQASVSYMCQEEGFHEDPNDCRTFYRCVDWGNGSPLTPFKFKCGEGTVFSQSKGNVCVHPNDSGRPECCEPGNEIDSNESGSGNNWNQESQQPEQPNYPSTQPSYPSSQKPQQPSYPSQTQTPHQPSYPSEAQKPPQPIYPPQTEKPQQPSYPIQSEKPQKPTYLPPTQKPQTPSYPLQTKQPPQPSYPSSNQKPNQSGAGGCNGCGSSPGCTEEGFFSNSEDCHKFYRCVNEDSHLQRYDFTCGTGTAWDEALQTCNYEHDVASCGTVSQNQSPNSQSATSVRPPTTQSSQSSKYPGSNNSITSLPQSTHGPMHSSHPPSQSTLKPYPTQSVSQSTKGPEYIPPQQSSTNIPTSSGSGTSSSGTPSTGGRPCTPSGSSKDCIEEGFFPHPQDCHKFYRCVNENGSFHRYDFECGTGTAWDQELQTCNYEDTVPSCESSISEGQSPESDSSSAGQQPSSNAGPQGSGEPQPSSTLPTPSSSQSTNLPSIEGATSLATISTFHPTSQVNQPSTESIPQSTKKPGISSTIQSQQQTIVSSTQSTLLPPQQTSQPQPTLSPSESQSTSSSDSGSSQSQKPSGQCKSEGFFPNPEDCRKFYRCVSNPPAFIKYDFDCGPGTAWDQSLLTCNYIAQVATCDSGQNEIEPNQPPSSGFTTTSPSSESTSTPTSSNTSITSQPEENKTEPSEPAQTTITSTESSTEGSPTKPILIESSSTSSSSNIQSSTEPSLKPDCNPPKSNNTIVCNTTGFYPHPTRCDKFYRCVDNGKGFNVYHFDCAPGTIFDPSIDVCNYPESVYPARDCQTGESAQATTSQRPSQPAPTAQTPTTSVETTTKSQISTSTTLPLTEGTTSISSEATTSKSSTEGSSTTVPQTSETTENISETTTSSEATTPSSESTTLGSEATTPGSETTASSSEATTPGSETITSSSEATTPGSDMTTINLEVTTSATESTMSGSEPTTTVTTSAETTTSGSIETTSQEATSEATTTSSESTSPEEQQSTTSATTQETITTSMTTTDSQESTTPSSTDKPSITDNCPMLTNLTDEQVVLVCPTGFRRHPKLCNLFYQCTTSGSMEVKVLILQCPNGTMFDEKDNKCLPETESSQPCIGSIAEKRVQRRVSYDSPPLVEVSTKSLCPEEGHFPYREGCSNIFYKCKRDSKYALQGYLYKCPKNFVYWSVSRRCERASRLPMCTDMSNETEDENEIWENRWEIPIEDRNLSSRSLIYY